MVTNWKFVFLIENTPTMSFFRMADASDGSWFDHGVLTFVGGSKKNTLAKFSPQMDIITVEVDIITVEAEVDIITLVEAEVDIITLVEAEVDIIALAEAEVDIITLAEVDIITLEADTHLGLT
jgi:hypothetical protein